MKILYATGLTPNDTSLHRLWALERLGHQVIPFNSNDYIPRNPIMRRVAHRLIVGPGVSRLNRDILEAVKRERPDAVWADKLLYMRPSTIERIRDLGVFTVSYMIDNFFGPRNDPGWRLYRKCIPHYDLHVVQRDQNLIDYRSHSARDVIKIQTAYEPTIQYPPPDGWSDADRTRGVSFIGTPYDNRAEILTRLWREHGLPVVISGHTRQWARAMEPDAYKAIFHSGELYRDAYREGIWGSKINLSFITHSNLDEFAHKSFEIAGAGGFLLAERSQGHMDRFKEDEEAVFFTGFDEMAAKIQRYLPDEAARNRIAAAGRARAERDGYYNDRQVSLIVDRIRQTLESRSPK